MKGVYLSWCEMPTDVHSQGEVVVRCKLKRKAQSIRKYKDR